VNDTVSCIEQQLLSKSSFGTRPAPHLTYSFKMQFHHTLLSSSTIQTHTHTSYLIWQTRQTKTNSQQRWRVPSPSSPTACSWLHLQLRFVCAVIVMRSGAIVGECVDRTGPLEQSIKRSQLPTRHASHTLASNAQHHHWQTAAIETRHRHASERNNWLACN